MSYTDTDVQATGGGGLASVQAAEVQRLQAEVERQQERIRSLEHGYDARGQIISRYEDDFGAISEELAEEARRRGWCGEYGQFVERVNNRTSNQWLDPGRVDQSASFHVSVTWISTEDDAEAVRSAILRYIDRIRVHEVNAKLSDSGYSGVPEGVSDLGFDCTVND